MSKMPQTKRGKRTYVDQSERLSHKFVTVRRRLGGNEPLPFGWACMASTIAGPAVDLTGVAAPSFGQNGWRRETSWQKGRRVGSTSSDDANSRGGGRVLAPFTYVCGRSSIGESASCGSLLSQVISAP